MSAVSKTAKATGVVSVAVGGVTAAFTAEDLAAWLGVVTSYAPVLLCCILFWWIYKVDRQHGDCQRKLGKMQESLTELKVEVAVMKQAGMYKPRDIQ